MNVHDLISPAYLTQNRMIHEGKGHWGGSGWKHAEVIQEFGKRIRARSILDYGCGECSLRKMFGKIGYHVTLYEYDPAVFTRARLPKYPVDLVVCTDVLEHIEPDKLATVLKHIRSLATKGIYLSIATRPANKILPDGRNAHLIIEDTPWWRKQVETIGFKVEREEDVRKGDVPREVRYWLVK